MVACFSQMRAPTPAQAPQAIAGTINSAAKKGAIYRSVLLPIFCERHTFVIVFEANTACQQWGGTKVQVAVRNQYCSGEKYPALRCVARHLGANHHLATMLHSQRVP